MANNKEHLITEKSLIRATMVGLFLLVLLCLLAPLTIHFHLLGKGIFWLLGLAGYSLLSPFIMFMACAIFVKGGWPHKWGTRLSFGYPLVLLGISIIWEHIAMGGKEVFDLANYNQIFAATETSSLYGTPIFSGGFFAYFLSCLFLQGGVALLYLFGFLLILGGNIIIFFPLLAKAYRHICNTLAIKRSAKVSAKQEAVAEAERQAILEQERNNPPLSKQEASPFGGTMPSSQETLSNPVFPSISAPKEAETPAFTSHAPDKVMVEEEEPVPNRLNAYHEEERNPMPQPLNENHFNFADPSYAHPDFYHSGLQEAVFPSFGKTPSKSEVKSSKPLEQPAMASMVPPISSSIKKEELFVKPEPQVVTKEVTEEKPAEAVSPIRVPPVSPVTPPEEAPTPIEAMVAPVEPSLSPIETPSATPFQEEPAEEEKPVSLVEEAPTPLVDENVQPPAHALPNYILPGLDLLNVYPDTGDKELIHRDCETVKDNVNSLFQEFGVGASVVSYTIGPSVTRYNIKTDSGVSVGSIGKYIQDISVRLGGIPTRYEEVLHGQNTSGLEIANKTTTTVSLKDVVAHLPPLNEKTNLYIPFGESISGDFISGDLSEFPHMLISGSTGSGKSIFMQGIIMSLIMRNRPEDLKLVMVDPKRVELCQYKDIPHLLCPIIKEPVQAKVCFEKLIGEMERRYSVFENAGVRNIREFNSRYAPSHNVSKIPFIVTIVDEYADLVDSCKTIGDSVVRIAQKARAAGIHLIIATQRPTVNVITGTIKANLATRVALSVASSQDSIAIIGQGGAEDLAGRGDMLVECSQVLRNGFIRCQGCYADTSEINAVCDFIRSQMKPSYDSKFLDLADHSNDEAAIEESAGAPSMHSSNKEAAFDELYETVKETVMQREYTSMSKIQREFQVGFPRAGKLFNMLQKEGIVAMESENASRGCKVLKHSSDEAPKDPTIPLAGDNE